jgi:PEP-CTERM motif-containing protein
MRSSQFRRHGWACVVVLIFLVCGATSAFADSFSFSYTGSGVTASGTFTTNSLSGGSYLITAITGTRNGQSMTLLAPLAFDGNDNLLFPTSPVLNFKFSFTAGGVNYNVYFNSFACCGGTTTYYETSTPGVLGTQINFSASAVPEPSAFVLLISGLAAIGWGVRRKIE